MVLAAAKYRNIAAKGYFNSDWAAGALAGEIARKRPPNPGRLDANNWISLRVETIATPESLNADRVALDVLGLAAERQLDDEAKKSDKLRRPAEGQTDNNTLHRGANLLRRGNVATIVRSLHSTGVACC
ncbi:MAG: hypothetical protein ACLQNV_20450 [Steroidobacteraceae bacterium]|jgi:hypothetical protein